VHFTLVDSIAKKIKVVESIAAELGLSNVTPRCERFENIREQFHFITGRAVTALPDLVSILRTKISDEKRNPFSNGILYLKGGDVSDELEKIGGKHKVYPLNESFPDPFFLTKKLIYLYDL
jgi:16S rRNA (guanine527-N7)-methyltransferase